jgi:hypothetical protein
MPPRRVLRTVSSPILNDAAPRIRSPPTNEIAAQLRIRLDAELLFRALAPPSRTLRPKITTNPAARKRATTSHVSVAPSIPSKCVVGVVGRLVVVGSGTVISISFLHRLLRLVFRMLRASSSVNEFPEPEM